MWLSKIGGVVQSERYAMLQNRRHVSTGFLAALITVACGISADGNRSADETVSADGQATNRGQDGHVPVYTYRVVNAFLHDPNAFTQGLVFADGFIYEGTGLRGESSLRIVDLDSGTVLKQVRLQRRYFGEGITIFDDRIMQLTWESSVGFVYDKEHLTYQGNFSYPTEGWGLTHNGRHLILSDGTANLYFLDPETFDRIGQLPVRDERGLVKGLNELEFINGEIFANVWKTDMIVRINPDSGRVVGRIDLSGLLDPKDRHPQAGVLNGIAYDAQNDRLFVTGKHWPKLFEIKLVSENAGAE